MHVREGSCKTSTHNTERDRDRDREREREICYLDETKIQLVAERPKHFHLKAQFLVILKRQSRGLVV